MATRQMSVQDQLWLTMDRPNNLMVVDGAMMLTGTPTLDEVKDVFRAATERFPVFRRKPVRQGSSWVWVDDPTFSLDNHVTQVELDGPADIANLQKFVSEQRARPLNKRRPLWTSFLVAPVVLDDGTVGSAVVTRFHHAIADGVRLVQVLIGMCEIEDGTTVPMVARKGAGEGAAGPVDTAVNSAAEAGRVSVAAARAAVESATETVGNVTTSLSGALLGAASKVATDPMGALASAPQALVALPGIVAHAASGLARGSIHGVEEGITVVRHPDRLLDALEVLGVEDHRTINDLTSVTKLLFTDSGSTVWTGKPGSKKAVYWASPVPMDVVKRIGKAQGATVNDVMVTAVAGGLQRYLTAHQSTLDEVVWMVPVNLVPFADNLPEDLGNYFALIFLPMPLDADSSRDRLMEMHHRMERIKHSDEAVLTFGLQRTVSMSPSAMAYFLTNFFANKAVGVLTNVPGPDGPMTFAGQPVSQVVGFAPCSGDQPMTATIFSYNDEMTVGFATDAKLIPDPDLLATLVLDELAQMASELGGPVRGRSRVATGSNGSDGVAGELPSMREALAPKPAPHKRAAAPKKAEPAAKAATAPATAPAASAPAKKAAPQEKTTTPAKTAPTAAKKAPAAKTAKAAAKTAAPAARKAAPRTRKAAAPAPEPTE